MDNKTFISVNDLIDRLVEEDPTYALYRPGLGISETQHLRPATKGNTMNWLPNRKIVAVFFTGLLSWIYLQAFKVEADPELITGVVGLLMTLIGYLVPLPESPES